MRAPIERLTIWLAALVCLFVTASLRDVPHGGAPLPFFAEPDHQATGSLSVRVVAGGGGYDGARVRLFDGRDTTRGEELADGESKGGEVRFDALDRGAVWLVVEAVGFARQSRLVVVTEEHEEVEVALAPAESFEVVVVDAAQRPVRNAVVVVHANDPLPTPGYTDPSGLASFDALDTGPYSVEVVAQGFERKLLRELAPSQSPVFVKLEREAELIVHVVDPVGVAAGEATVLLAGSSAWPPKRLLTDEGGRVAFSGLPSGYYELRATRGGTVSEVGDGVMLEPGQQREVDVHLVEGTFVEVLVTDGDGEPFRPLADADVALVEGGLSSFPVYGRSDDGGVAKLGPIVGGDATVSAEASGFVAKHGVPVEQGQGRVRVALLRAGKLEGRVVDDRGYPIEGASLEVLGVAVDGMPIADSPERIGIHRDHAQLATAGPSGLVPRGELGVMAAVPGVPLTSPDLSPHAATAPTGPAAAGLVPWISGRDGSFALAPVTPGRVQLFARHPRYVDTIAAPVALAPGEHAEVTVVMRRGGTLEGRIFEGSRQPVAAARIELLSPDGSVERITFSADDGGFAFTAVPADVVLAVARAEEPETIVERLALEVPPDTRRDVEIFLPSRREAVTFRVVDDRGFRLDRAELSAFSLDPETALARTAFTDESGEARLVGARNLPLRLVVRRRGHAPLVTELERAPAELTIALSEEVLLEGEVRSRDGWLPGAAVTLLFAAGERHAKTDGGGRFTMVELARGPARLLVTAKGYAFEEKDIVLEPDSRGRVQLPSIELSRGAALEGVVVDDRGSPVAGARVALGRVPTYLPAGPLPPGVTHTDGAGRFSLLDLEAGDGSVEAYKLGVGRASIRDLLLRVGETTRDVRVELAAEDDALPESSAAASLAVTLSEHRPASRVALLLDHVPYGGEAQRAGLLAGDELTRIDGHAVLSLEEARRRLDGPLSHDMVLELYRAKTGTYRVRVRREKLRP